MLEDGWKNLIRMKNDNGRKEEAEKHLLKVRLSEYERLDTEDKLFVSYCLAFYSHKNDNMFMANKHIKDLKEIFKKECNVLNYQVEYHKFLWLNTNINHKEMSINIIVKDMFEVHEYYKGIKNIEMANAALFNIFGFKNDREGILGCLEEILKCKYTKDLSFIDDILDDCENTNHNLYIEVLNIVRKYVPTFNVDAI